VSIPAFGNLAKPLLLYDGECRFCCKWIARWEETGKGVIDFAPSQSGAGEAFGFPASEPLEAVKLIEGEGSILSGAAAVFRLMSLSGNGMGSEVGSDNSILWGIYQDFGMFRALTEWGYRLVAEHRSFFAMLTTLLWGRDVRKPTYEKSSQLFLRLLALVYGTAFGGLWWQVRGLIGPDGILPAGEYLARAHEVLGVGAYWQLPTLFWITGCSGTALATFCALGTSLSLGAFIGISWFCRGWTFLILEIFYLSLVTVGQVFLGYQWDALLLEAGFLAIFLAPWSWGRRKICWPNFLSSVSRWLLVWLLFRLIFCSALVKWLSGDSAWRDLSALEYHFWTQPLPNPGGWLAGQFPERVLRLMTLGMFLIEFGAPWLLFGPRNLRLLGASLIALLQLCIALTGNYGFFNLLTIALCVLLIDDRVWPWEPRTDQGGSLPICPEPSIGRLLTGFGAALIFLLSLVPMPLIPKPPLLAAVYEALEPLRLVNGYGLFAVMTRQRDEIIVEGSEDGVQWLSYNFRFKPGDPHRPPPFVELLMPRLDWQMWFAALGTVQENPWFGNFLVRLFEGDRAVLDLLEEDPFHGKPPRFLRARMKAYGFSTPHELRKEGLWWTFTPRADYLPAVVGGKTPEAGTGQ